MDKNHKMLMLSSHDQSSYIAHYCNFFMALMGGHAPFSHDEHAFLSKNTSLHKFPAYKANQPNFVNKRNMQVAHWL